MYRLLFLALIACSGDPPCPGTLGCSENGSTCERTLENGRTAACHCSGYLYTCTDCPDGERPIGACTAAGQTCGVWGFENACACTCGEDGTWSCAVNDPDPHFHCAP